MDYNKLTVKKLRDLIKKRSLELPTLGSGKYGNIIKADLVRLLETKEQGKTIDDLHLGPKLKILDILKPRDLINMCKTNKKFASICRGKNFWILRYKKDFPYTRFDTSSYLERYELRASMDFELYMFLRYIGFNDYNYEKQLSLYNSIMELLESFKNYIKPNMSDQDKYIFKEYIVENIFEIIPYDKLMQSVDDSGDLDEINNKLLEGRQYSLNLLKLYNNIEKKNYIYEDILYYKNSDKNSDSDSDNDSDEY